MLTVKVKPRFRSCCVKESLLIIRLVFGPQDSTEFSSVAALLFVYLFICLFVYGYISIPEALCWAPSLRYAALLLYLVHNLVAK